MYGKLEVRLQSPLEVALLPDNGFCTGLEKTVTAKMTKNCCMLCCLSVEGKLTVSDVSEHGTPVNVLEDTHIDFIWEVLTDQETVNSSPKLLTVTANWNLRLYEVISKSQVTSISKCHTDTFLQLVQDNDSDGSELVCAELLSFIDSHSHLLLNKCMLVELLWHKGSNEPEVISSCLLSFPPVIQETCTAYQLCKNLLFMLTSTGFIYVFDSTTGKHLATVDLSAHYLEGQAEVEPVRSLSSFHLLHISQDLSTAVAATSQKQALALDLNDYFSTHPGHLLCKELPTLPHIMPSKSYDQDSIASATYSQSVLSTQFQVDQSWETKLTLLYKRAKSPDPPSFLLPWYRHLSCPTYRQAAANAKLKKTTLLPGGTVMSFTVPEDATPTILNVSEFSAVLTFTSAGNSNTTLAYWDFESQNITYYCLDVPAVPICRSDKEHLSLILKASGLSLVLFTVTQEELLNRLMVFGSAGMVDSLCHLNDWGRCSMPIHALQAGLKNRQLDMVDFFLKSKKNILSPSANYGLHEQPAALSTQMQLNNIQGLRPALDLLRSAIRDTHIESQSRQFCEQLLSMTLNFLNTQIRLILTSTPELDTNLQECVKILDGYISTLRTYLKKYPWSESQTSALGTDAPDTTTEDEWQSLSVEEVVQHAVLNRDLPRAQAYLRRRNCPEQKLENLRRTGLRLAFNCLINQDLQQATTLLTNMGFNVKEQLHNICVHTADRELRAFMVEELMRQQHLSPEELEKVEFIKQVENLYSTPAMRTSKIFDKSRVLQISQSEAESRNLLMEILKRDASCSLQSMLNSVRLDWIRHWDKDTQKSVLLSRLPDHLLCSCEPAVLWFYLTSLHNMVQVTTWLTHSTSQDSRRTGATQWPALTASVVDGNTRCSEYIRNQILDMLSRQGVFVHSEMSDFEQLLWRLGKAGGVMQGSSDPPVPQFNAFNGQDFHKCFIQHCLENGLQYLLYAYLEHYSLTHSNCPVLGDLGVYESYPWFEMMVKLQNITRDATDPERVFQASLTSAQVLLPGSQASVSSMLLEGHSLFALATLMFAPGGIDQVVSEGDKGQDVLSRVDLQLLRMALRAYPKLKAALFSQSGPKSTAACDISVYHLMQSLHPLDSSKLFGWQAANTLGTSDTSAEPPHFSSPHLVNKYALIENLDFLYYLQHGRPSFAYGIFIIQHLSNSSNIQLQINRAVEQAHFLALSNFNNSAIAAACVCFCELLGVSSLKLRVDLKALNLIFKLWSQNCEDSSISSLRQTLVDKVNKLVTAEKQTLEELLLHLEGAVRDSVESRGINRSSFEAGQEWALPVQFCHLHDVPLSARYLQDCACDGQWLNFLLFVQLHHYPPQQVKSLTASFSPSLQAHLILAFQDLQIVNPTQSLKGEVCSLLKEESPEGPKDLFQILFYSQEHPSPWRYLLTEAVTLRTPLLTVLAACHQDAELLQCLCVWILISVNSDIIQEATSHINESLGHHIWNLHDLSNLWKTLLQERKIRPLIRGFQLFQRESPLILMLQIYELCYDYKNYQGAKDKLLEFQKCLLNLRSSGGMVGSDCLPVQWVEAQASVLLLTLMQQCETKYELCKLLQLLADMERLLKSNGPDFKKLSELSQILADTPVPLSPCLLENYTTETLQAECQKILDMLQKLGLFSQARRVVELAGLPNDRLIINKLLHDLEALKAKRQWDRQETRLAFWKRCQEQFKADCIEAEAACQFFMSQTEDRTLRGTELLQVQEQCLLLALAAHWLCQRVPPVCVERLAELEKRQWELRVRRLVLTTALEQQSLFAPVAGPENAFDSLFKEYSFSKIAILDNPTYLNLDGLPATEEDCSLEGDERKALNTLIGQLLDEGSVHEASRACRYFGLLHRDVRLVLQCRGLACGEIQPGLHELLSPDQESRGSLPSFSSTGSLSSFVVVSSPEDQVLSQLQMLVDQCRHGKSYCKQVLSLYELSKELRCAYSEISSEEPGAVLGKVLLSQQPERFKKAQALISVHGLQSDSVAQLISSSVLDGLMASSQDKEMGNKNAERHIYSPFEGKEAFLQLTKLCGDPNLVGMKLLDSIPMVPLSELGCTVELLILAHDCFSVTCNMEGIVRVLQAARHLSHTHLAHGEGYGLLVRLLTGIGRYNEMTYIFDLLNQNHRFEMLLRKKVESNTRLKTALLDYIKRCLPGDSEKHNMVALCFSMRREIGENHEGAARTQLKLIESQPWVVTPELKSGLEKARFLLKDATESYSKDSCMRQALRCVRMAKLITLQIHFLNHGQDLRVINLRPSELLSAIIALPRCYQVFVVAEAYEYSPDWAEILYQKVMLNGDFSYLEEFKLHRPLPASLFEEISKKLLLSKPPSSASQNLKKLLQYCEDVYTHYKLAYEHKFIDVANNLLQDNKTNGYLNDRLSS